MDAIPDPCKIPDPESFDKMGLPDLRDRSASETELSKEREKEHLIDTKGKPANMDVPLAETTPLVEAVNNQSQNLSHIPFSLPADDVWKYMINHYFHSEESENDVWFNLVINKSTEKVISVSIGKL